MNKQIDANMNQGMGTEGAPAQGAQGAHVQGVQGAHVQGAQVKWQDDLGAKRRLTLPQKRVLEQLAILLRGEKKTICCMYRKIGAALGMSKRAARVHVDALKKKGLIFTTVTYHPKDPRQRIGVCISIHPDAPIKHLPRKLSETEMQELKERIKKQAECLEQIKRGVSFWPRPH